MPPLPNFHTSRPFSTADHLAAWAHEGCSLSDLLVLNSNTVDLLEPPWLSLCEHLVSPKTVGMGQLAHNPDHVALERLRNALWARDAQQAIGLDSQLFGPDRLAAEVPQETQLRAIAIAEWARQQFDFPSDRKEPWDNPIDAELHPLERVLLERHWVLASNRLKQDDDDATTLTVMLVNDRAPADERGRLCRLRLWKVDLSEIPGGAAWHGSVVRAPAAMLLTLKGPDPQTGEMDDSFERALRKLETVLEACLTAPAQGGKGACAVAWSLQPVMMNRERADGRVRGIPWGMAPVTGGSATLPFVLGALVLLRRELRQEHLVLREQLRAIEPARIAMSAAFRGDTLPDDVHPLDWPLEPIRGLGDKLGAFVQDELNQSKAAVRAHLILVGEGQTDVPANTLLKVEAPATLRQAIEIAARHAQSPLPEAVQSVLDFLLGEARRLNPLLASDAPLSPPLTTAQLYDLRNAEPAHDWPRGGHRAAQWHLLQRYAVWAGGEHQLWGAPARLAKDFAPILLKPQARHDAVRGHGESTAGEFKEREKANSLYDLLRAGSREDRNNFQQPRVWVLTAPPAAGKSTLLAEFEMHMAWRALCQFAGSASEHFGEVPLWVPASGLVLQQRDKDDRPLPMRPLRQALTDWLRLNRPELGEWPELLHAKHFKIRLMLDGVNELDCASHERQQLLGQWLNQDYPPDHRHLPLLITVRSLEQSFVFDGDRQAELVPWNKEQREHYINQRLQGHPEHLAAMHAAVTQDAESAKDDPTRMLYSSPGMLALGCTLMEQNLLPLHALNAAPGQTVNRARLLATYVWSVLRRERGKPHLPPDLLGPEELERLPRLEQDLQGNCWMPPEEPGPLLAALRAQAWAMQPRVQLPETQWFAQNKGRRALLTAADHLSLVGSIDAGSVRGRKQVEHRWRHHLLMEWFAAYGLSPDDLPPEAAAPAMDSEETQYLAWQQAREAWQTQRTAERQLASAIADDAEAIDESEEGGDGVEEVVPVTDSEEKQALEIQQAWNRWQAQEEDKDGVEEMPELLEEFRLSPASVSHLEEPIKLASQLRGTAEDWVSRLIDIGNAPLAARIAWGNWADFGEPIYPHADPLGPWRPNTTHPVLNRLRIALHDRMHDPTARINQRNEAGTWLGLIGGSPLFRICGDALLLQDEHWTAIGAPNQSVSFEMGDLLGRDNERTTKGRLLKVRDISSYLMSQLLVTKAQYWCFILNSEFESVLWWPGEARIWWETATPAERRGHHAFDYGTKFGRGLVPMQCNFWQAQAYALWEAAQRRASDAKKGSLFPRLPTEAEWEGGARWCAYEIARNMQRGASRWRFPHTHGQKLSGDEVDFEIDGVTYRLGKRAFGDVRPWDFNHGGVIELPTSVGVFLEGHPLIGSKLPRDLAGNVEEWTSSSYRERLDDEVLNVGKGRELRSVRGGSSSHDAWDCRVGSRYGRSPDFPGYVNGFRLVLAGPN